MINADDISVFLNDDAEKIENDYRNGKIDKETYDRRMADIERMKSWTT